MTPHFYARLSIFNYYKLHDSRESSIKMRDCGSFGLELGLHALQEVLGQFVVVMELDYGRSYDF